MKTSRFTFRELILKALFVLMLLLASLPTASGDPMSAEQAKAAVRGWLKADRGPLQTTLGQKVKRVETFNDANGTVLYHVVYLDPEGFVIVAGDNLIEPIIGFAPHGQFDPSTQNPLGALVSNDLPNRHASVKGITAANAQGSPRAAKSKWERLNRMDQAGPGVEPLGITAVSDVWVAPLTQTAWSQSTDSSGNACYNYYTPPYAAGCASNYFCGCTATAMAQLMRFWQYPVSSVGTNSFPIAVAAVPESRNLLGGDGLGGPYVWSDMVLAPSGSSTLAQRQAIGALCADAGVSVGMNYDAGGSAGTLDGNGALVNTFGYANAVHGLNGNATIGSGLTGMVNPNLDAGCPVLLAIEGTFSAHAIVCDGYGYHVSALYHHLNLGWAGSDTAWYNLPTIDTSQGTFTSVYECVYNVWTNGTGEIISGRVTDSGGNPIPGVVVTATRSEGETYSAASNTNGIYALAQIPSCSTYAVSASKAGYSFTEPIVTTGQSSDNSASSGNQWAINFSPVPQDYLYTTNSGTVTITNYIGSGGAVTIPGTINGLLVSSLGDSVFNDCISLTSVTIPTSVTNIGNHAFYACTSLTNVTFGNGVTSIGDYAFYACGSLTNVIIPASVTSIEDDAFASCTNLTGVYCQGNAPSLGLSVFESDNNATVYYSQGTTGWGATLGGLPTHEQILYTFTTNNGTITITGYLGSGGAVTIPGTINGLPVTSIGAYAFYWANLSSVAIGASVTNIGDCAFFCSRLTSVTMGNNLVSIGYMAFGACLSLSRVTIGTNVTNIGDEAFASCISLTNVTIPASVTRIGDGAFSDCHILRAITVDPINPAYCSVTGVLFDKNQTALIQCPGGKVGGYSIPAGVISIGDDAFYDCGGLTNVTIGNGVTSIGDEAFYGCNGLTSVTMPASVTSIGDEAFYSCSSLTAIMVDTNNPAYSSVAGVLFDKNQTALIQCPGGKVGGYTIPASVTSIGDEAFGCCFSLTNVTFDNGVASIGDWAFYACTSLTSVTIPASVTSIGDYAFSICGSLTGVYFQGNAPSLGGSNVFLGDDNATVYYLQGTTGWTSPFGGLPATLWQQVLVTVTANPTQGGTVTGSGTYWGGANVQLAAVAANGWWFLGWSDGATNNPYSITVPATNTAYDAYFTDTPPQFSYTTTNGAITVTGYTGAGGAVAIPDTIAGLPVTGIGRGAFQSCANVTSVTIGTNVTSIGFAAFLACPSLTDVMIPDGVTSIGMWAFNNCYSLTNVTIPNSVTSIGYEAFPGCSSLTAIMVDANNPAYRSVAGVLFDKTQTTLIQCPGGKAGSYTIPNSVTNIGDEAFIGCISLTCVTIPNSVTSLGSGAFLSCSSLTSVTTPNSVTSIGSYAFSYCASLTNVTIGNGVTSIGDYAFCSCSSLTSVTIPNSVASIGDWAFCYCTSLTGVCFQGNAPSLSGSNVFSGDGNATVYYLPGTTGWGATTYGSRPAVLWNVVVLNPGSLNQVYDGSPKIVTATTTPGGLAVAVSYDGSATAPTAVGSYRVTATVNDPSYTGSASGTLTVTTAALTITANNRSKTYGESLTITGTEFMASGLAGNDAVASVALTSAGARATATVAGSPYSIVPSSATGPGLGNYTISYQPGALAVNPASLTITANSRSKTYGQAVTFAGTEFTASGLVGSDAVTSVALTSAGARATATVAGSPYSIVPSSATGPGLGNYAISYQPGALAVNTASLTITANSRSKIYGQAVSFAGTEYTPAGLVNGDTVSSVTLSSAGAATSATVAGSPYSIAPSSAVGPGLGNYAISYQPGVLTVTPAALTITANNRSKTYGQAVTFAGTEFTLTGLQNSDTVGTVTLTSSGAAAAAEVAGSPYSIVPSAASGGTGLGNYTISYQPGTLAVTPAALMITANDRSKIYGQSVTFAGTEFTASGLMGSDTVASVALTSAGAAATATVAGSPYSIAPSSAVGPGLGNYAISYQPGALAVIPAALTVSADDKNRAYGTTNPMFTATYNGFVDGENTNVLAGSPAWSTVADTNSPVGSYPIEITQGTLTNANYGFNFTNGSLTITPYALTVTADSTNRLYGAANPALTGTVGGTQNGDNITATFTTPAGVTSAVGQYVITPVLSDPDGRLGNYSVTTNNGVLTVGPVELTVTGITAANKVYDGTTAAAVTGMPVATGVIGGDVVSVNGTATGGFADKNVGTGKGVAVSGLALAGTDAGNYTLIPPTLTANITPAGLTITGLAANNKVYDASTAATLTGTPVPAGVIGTDAASLGGTPVGVFGDKTVGNNKPVTVSGLSLGGTDAGNYTLSVPSLSANITPAGLTISGLAASNKVYDGTTAAMLTGPPALSGVIGSDAVSVSGTAVGAFASKTVGTSKSIAVSGLALAATDAGNYTLTQPTLTANIMPKGLTVTGLTGNSKVYDGTTAATLTGTPALNGVVVGDSVSLSGTATGAFASKSVGTSKSIAVSGLALAGTDAGNYTLTQPALTADITPKGLTVIGLSAYSKVYDGTTAATLTGTPAVSGVIAGDVVSVSGTAAGVFNNKNAGTGKTVTVSGFSLTGADAGSYALGVTTLTANITPASLTVTGITAANKVYDGTTTATLNTASAAPNGVLPADAGNVTLLTTGATGSFADKSVGAGKLVTISGLTLSGSAAGNYALTQPTTTADIIVGPFTVTNPTLVGQAFSVSVPTVLGANYTLEYKNAFTDTDWTDVQTLPGTGGTITLTDSAATNSARFYRVRVGVE